MLFIYIYFSNRELAPKFPAEIEQLAINAVDKHDQNNFDESVDLW
jgi:hypothetical protein